MMSNQNTTAKNSRHASSNRSNSKQIIRTILSCIFSFMLALSLFVFSIVLVVRFALSEKYTISCIDSSYYYTELKQNLEEEIWDYTIPTGVDPSVTVDIFDTETIQNDLQAYIGNTFRIRQYTINTSAQETVLKERVYAFLETEGTPTEPVNPEDSETELDEESVKAYNAAVDETNKAVDEYVSEIMDIYRKSIKLVGLDYLVKIGNEYQKYLSLILIISILFGALNGFFCMKVHKLPHRGLRYLVYGFSGGFLMTFIAPFIVYLTGFYNRLIISPDYFRGFLVAFIKGVLALFMVTSQIWLLIAIILGIIVAVLRKKSLRKHSKSSGRREQENKEEGLNEEADLFNETDITEEADWVKTAIEE